MTGGVSPPFADGSVLRASARVGKQQGKVDIEPEALARLVGWSTTLKALAPRLRCSHWPTASRSILDGPKRPG